MNKQHNLTSTMEERQRLIALWAAGVFAATGLIFFGYSIYHIAALQQGRMDLSDKVLMPMTAMMFLASIISYGLIRRGRHALGTGLLFFMGALVLPVTTVLVLKGMIYIAILYIVSLATIMIGLVLPNNTRRTALVAASAAVLLCISIEYWNPSFRITTGIGNFTTVITVLTAAVLTAFIVRQSRNNISHFISSSISNRLTTLVMILTIPLLIGITVYISFQAGSEIEARSLHNLQQNNQSLAKNVSTWFELHARSAREMALLPDIISMDATLQKPTLLAISSTHPNLFLVQTADMNGINVARSDDAELNDYHDRAWFLGAKEGASVTSEALISRTIGKPALNIATPIFNESGKIVGVASIVSELSEISKEVVNIEEGQGITYIVDAKNRVIAHPDSTYTENELRDLSTYPPIAFLNEGKVGQIAFTDEEGVSWIAYVDRLDNGWGVVAQQPEAVLLESVRQFQTTTGILIVIGTVLMSALTWFAIRRMLQPIGTLTSTVSAIAAGDLNRKAEVKSQDEIGTLAATFNDMTSRLRESFSMLEQRVADRTRNLELAAEVGRTVSQVRTLDVMLKDAAEIIRLRFDLYYTQIYLTNQAQNALILQAGTGKVGAELVNRGHQLLLNTGSINGRAVVEKRSVLISDTTASTTFRPNPLLPETRSEMAVPLMIGERVVGVLDLQDREAGKLNQESLSAFEALAGQLAIAIQNANFLAETEQARAEIESQARRQARSNWIDYMDAIHKPEEAGYMFKQNNITSMSQAEQSQLEINDSTLTAPIAVTGETLGNLVVEMEGQSPIVRTNELINIVARQVAQQIENLRLLNSAERYRFEAEEAARRQARENWKEYKETNTSKSMSYMYDLKEVRSFNSENDQQPKEFAATLPLKVRDETIGKLVVQGLGSDDAESLALANVVAERLSAHIEALRQFEETKRGQIELDKRAHQLAAVAEVSSVSSRELDIDKMLHSVVHLTQRQFGLYHAHVFTYNENTAELNIAACGYKEGDEHEGTDGTAVIPLAQEKSLVARAARTRQAVIVNDVRSEPGWLSNPLLPDTASELAVPLIIGDQILGVLDVQSDIINAFSEEDANIYTTLAAQVSTALQNARSFVKAQQQAERESTLNLISQKIQSATTVEAVLQIAARELGHALGAPMTIAQLSMKDKK